MQKIKFQGIFSILFLALILISTFSQAANLQLLQQDTSSFKLPDFSGYFFNTEQIFIVSQGPLKGKSLGFASKLKGPHESPRFALFDSTQIIDSKIIPEEAAYNIEDVKAISLGRPVKPHTLRILSILLLSPISNRDSDFWTQAFVFDISDTGKIEMDEQLNLKLANERINITSIQKLKEFLMRNPLR